ncbi:MAG: hypothetical protein EWV82_07970 [Microcystis aeruginosa Ma_AC_P_19900807_S299]|nr:MAG: hypothetical protein EWV82_07970 [Microcystis aeruginosa Ma_AC_P_19900807_S299]
MLNNLVGGVRSQLSVISYQLSVISYQLSVISSLRKLPTPHTPLPHHPTPISPWRCWRKS